MPDAVSGYTEIMRRLFGQRSAVTRYVLLLAAVAGVSASSSAQSQTSADSGALAALEQGVEDAVVRGDTVFLATVYAPEFTFRHSTGEIESRTEWLEALAGSRYEFRRVDSLLVTVVGDRALVTGRLHVRRAAGDPVWHEAPEWGEYAVRYARLYSSRGGRWQMLAHVSIAHAFCSSDSPCGAAVRQGFVETEDEVRLYYRLVGTGRDTVIVIHGGPGLSMDYFAEDLVPLAERGHALLFYDQRGAGGSSLVSDSASLSAHRFAEDLEAIRRHFAMERLTLLGHSWGAAVIALYASQYPERVGRMLIVGGVPMQRRDLVQAFRALSASRDSTARQSLRSAWETWLANPGDVSACRAYHVLWFVPFYGDSTAAHRSRGDFCAPTADALRNSVTNVGRFTVASLGEWDWRSSLREVTAPALVIHGTADPLPLQGARDWAAALPNGRLLVLEGIGHFPYVEAPATFFTAADEFLRGRWPEGARATPVP